MHTDYTNHIRKCNINIFCILWWYNKVVELQISPSTYIHVCLSFSIVFILSRIYLPFALGLNTIKYNVYEYVTCILMSFHSHKTY